MNKHLVFVYGTLRRGGPGAMSIRFPKAQFVTDAVVRGSLYDLGAYPGLLLDKSNSSVVGEIYEVDDQLLSELDDFEASSHYCRRQVDVSVGDYSKSSWIYVPEGGPDFYSDGTLVVSGDWTEYARGKPDRL